MRTPEIVKTRAGKLFLASWGAALLAFIAICTVGVVDREVAGAAAFAVLVSGAVINLSIVISWWGERGCQMIARASWIVLAVVSLLSAQVLLGAGNKDADIVMAYGTAVLSFPLGLLAGPIAAAFKIPGGMTGTA